VTIASRSLDFAMRLQQLLNSPHFRVYTNTDIVGTELAGAAKNVVAIAAGILDGLGSGNNAKAALVGRGLAEITRLGVAMGGMAETFAGLAGAGDLVATCFSPVGRNRSFGQAVGEGSTPSEAQARLAPAVVEGIASCASLLALAEKCNVEMPITCAVHDVLRNAGSPARAIADLMNRSLKEELGAS
jgi:glycerol-3-phosphate dehydrogenase (NAD(P)+)